MTERPLPSLPFEQPDPWQPPQALTTLAADGPIHRIRTRTGDTAWLVTSYPEVRQLLADDRLGMAHPDPDHAARASDSALFGGRPPENYDTEHADRARFRALLQPYFMPARMRALRARVDLLVANLLDDLESRLPPADLHDNLAVPLPVLVICELLGVPPADRPQFRAHTQQVAALDDHARSAAGLAALFDYTRGLVAEKRAHPQDDLISGLCATEAGSLDDDYIATLAAMVLFAGHETTVVQIGIGAVRLLSTPADRDLLTTQPEHAPQLVEEYLRLANTGGAGIPRYPRCDLDIANVRVPAGDLILLDVGAANHDPTIYNAPNRLDLHRTTSPHLSFGHGSHYCIGAPLARVELTAVFSQLLARFPTMRLALDRKQLPWRADLLTAGYAEIPITW
jgi:pentalenolactone synthase